MAAGRDPRGGETAAARYCAGVLAGAGIARLAAWVGEAQVKAGRDGDFGLVSFRGISGLLNNSTVDGGNNNNAFFARQIVMTPNATIAYAWI